MPVVARPLWGLLSEQTADKFGIMALEVFHFAEGLVFEIREVEQLYGHELVVIGTTHLGAYVANGDAYRRQTVRYYLLYLLNVSVEHLLEAFSVKRRVFEGVGCDAAARGVVYYLFDEAEKGTVDCNVGVGGQAGGHVQVFDSTHDWIRFVGHRMESINGLVCILCYNRIGIWFVVPP